MAPPEEMVWNSSSLTNSHMECFQEVINGRTRSVLPLRDDIVERSRETARQAVPPEMIIDCQLLQRSIWTASWWLSPSRKSSSLDTRTCTTFKPSSQQDSTEEILISQRHLAQIRHHHQITPNFTSHSSHFERPLRRRNTSIGIPLGFPSPTVTRGIGAFILVEDDCPCLFLLPAIYYDNSRFQSRTNNKWTFYQMNFISIKFLNEISYATRLINFENINKNVKTHGMVILRTMVYNVAKENNGIDWSVTKSISVELLMQN